MTFRDLLRSMPSMPHELPAFDAEAAPADPVELFSQWLEESAAAGQLLPHGATLSTADAEGDVTARVLVLRDIDDRGWAFSTHASSPKGRAMAANPHASLTFFWPVQGRQVRVEGRAERGTADESADDFRRRSEAARTALLVGRQSEPMRSSADFGLVTLQTSVAVGCSPATLDRDWAVYRVVPERIEFWQGSTSPEQDHVRLEYRPGTTEAGGSPWERTRLWP
ncbi:pyridoxal 5'-phosphate synthase [Rathayibacter sp. VKM Ac-2803]|uniref:pyridoxine/pyridoxamine 5'-phosphate oxidase n=1 Tax=unclassified Rathayibacter TaxID=2609250 RepID=UPI001358A3CD|nr:MULTISPECIES: pyridoxal 5'-phosphate synthase [unclassified Rathayibacter]MWV49817.1 pyridoxal 5'-phosphate synthase [Rathayibacter sp. VKM Ac-2803]MWV57948.1 pyridoxal 5'-phosphate synthase [Rathayibacter sp. VKM Ac-2754]